jgi:hypothetical protein
MPRAGCYDGVQNRKRGVACFAPKLEAADVFEVNFEEIIVVNLSNVFASFRALFLVLAPEPLILRRLLGFAIHRSPV